VATNVAAYRSFHRLSQTDLAEAMRAFGHPKWTRSTVSAVERAERQITLDELPALAICLGLPPMGLLDPGALPTGDERDLDYGTGRRIAYPLARAWITGTVQLHYWPPLGGMPGHVTISRANPNTAAGLEEVIEDLERRRQTVLGLEARPKEASA
jgi:transcriptional regulator with XRE-family HTH domain